MAFRMRKRVEAPREHGLPPWKIAISILGVIVMSPIIGLVVTFALMTFLPVIPLMAILLAGVVAKRHDEREEPFGTVEPSGSHQPSLENPHAFGQLG